MTVETATIFSQLDPDWPADSDLLSEGAAHIRLAKSLLVNNLSSIAGPLTVSQTDLNKVGITPAQTSNDTTPASTAFVQTAILNASLSGELPAQAGNTGKGLETNGTTASWGFQRKINRRAIVGADTAIVTDRGNALDLSGTFTLSFSAAATLTDGWYCYLSNTGTGVITLDPNSTELIDGAATVKLYPNQSCAVYCNGTAFYTIGRKTATVLLQTQTASASASLSFTNFVDAEFDDYFVVFDKLLPSSDGRILQMRTSTDGGSSYDFGASDYHYSLTGTSAAAGAVNVNTANSEISFTTAVGNVGSENGASGKIEFSRPSDASYFSIRFAVGWLDQSTVPVNNSGVGYRMAAADVDAFQLFYSLGNITSGTAKLYGIRK